MAKINFSTFRDSSVNTDITTAKPKRSPKRSIDEIGADVDAIIGKTKMLRDRAISENLKGKDLEDVLNEINKLNTKLVEYAKEIVS